MVITITPRTAKNWTKILQTLFQIPSTFKEVGVPLPGLVLLAFLLALPWAPCPSVIPPYVRTWFSREKGTRFRDCTSPMLQLEAVPVEFCVGFLLLEAL